MKTYGYLLCSILLILNVDLTSGQTTLYSYDEPIVQLSISNFTLMTNTDQAWLVEFYATWCGHCQRFAPIFSALAEDIKGWNQVIKVAAIACSNPENTPLCQNYRVSGYPTIKFLPPHAQNQKGYLYGGVKSVQALRWSVIHFLEILLDQEDPPENWPNLAPYSSVDEAWLTATDQTLLAFIVFEDVSSTNGNHFIGRELVMDFFSNPAVSVGRMTSEIGDMYSLSVYPSLNKVMPDGTIVHVASNKTREEFTEIIEEMLRQAAGETTTTTTTTTTSTTTTQQLLYPDGTHMQDLESALYYSLWVEVASHRIVDGEVLLALKNYIDVLQRYFPGLPHHMNFLTRVQNWLKDEEYISGTRWQQQISSLRDCGDTCEDTYDLKWVECEGSEPTYRGYPCGLWTTFHTLTVAAYNKKYEDSDFRPETLLLVISHYVRHFLGCRECAGHFLQMAARIPDEVGQPEDVVLWLWQAHNQANRRLSGDPTEDPEHPKVQFPSAAVCPGCRLSQEGHGKNISIEWDRDEVLYYLRRFYSASDVIDDASPSGFFTNEIETTSTSYITPTPSIPGSSPNCTLQSTRWGLCSRTCGVGISTRLSNDNQLCRMEVQTRMCQIRPCRIRNRQYQCQEGSPTIRNQFLRFGNCRTTRQVQHCKACSDKCCFPTRHHSSWVRASCVDQENGQPEVHRGYVQVMWVDECECQESCPEEQ